MNAPQSKKQGFTIIEVVLVLAIAALIFLMIFIALPALNRGQRDTARKNDATTVAAAVNSYKSNNKGALTGLTTANIRSYVDTLNQYTPDPNLTVNTARPNISAVGESDMIVYNQTKCGTTAPAPGNQHVLINTAATTLRNAAVVIRLENSGSATGWQAYCVEV